MAPQWTELALRPLIHDLPVFTGDDFALWRKVQRARSAVSRLLGNAAGRFGSASVPACGSCRIDTLSNRELEIFAMTGRGLGTRRIADILHLSPKTIQAYHGRIKDKLQLRDANELLREAICWVDRAGAGGPVRLH